MDHNQLLMPLPNWDKKPTTVAGNIAGGLWQGQ